MNFKNVTAGLCAAVMALTMLPAMSIDVHAAEAPAGKVYAPHVDSSKFPHATGSPMDAQLFGEKCYTLTGKITFSKEAYPGAGGVALNWDDTVFAVISGENATIYSRDGGGVFAPVNCMNLFYPTIEMSRQTRAGWGGTEEIFAATAYDFSGLDTSKVTNMGSMFYFFQGATLDLSTFDTSSVTNMSNMFRRTSVANLDVSNFDTSKVTAMSTMFGDTSATSIDVSNFNTSNVEDMYGMFSAAKATNIVGLTDFNTSNVTNMRSMFSESAATTLDLSSFDTSKVTDRMSSGGMFWGSKATSVLCRTEEDMNRLMNTSDCEATGFKVAPPKPVPEAGKEVNSSGGTGDVPVTLNTVAHTFSVTVPTSLPISVAADGTITCAEANACKVINNEEGPVDIKSVTLSGDNQWVIVPTSTAMESEAVNTKKLAMTVMGYNTNEGGLDTTAFQAQTINGNGDFGIVYTAKLPTQTVETDKAPVANVVFTIGWHEAA